MTRLVLVGLVVLAAGCGSKVKRDYAAYSSIPSLIECLKDKDAGVRFTAAENLGRYGANAKDAVPALTGALKDPDKNVRGAAAYALAGVGADARDSIPALREVLQDADKDVRQAATYAIRELEHPSPKPPKKSKTGKK